MAKLLVYALPFIVSIYALIDCIQTPTDEVQSLPKPAWVALIVFLPLAGPVAWLVAGRSKGTSRGAVRDRLLPGTPTRGKPVAPDDDPDFLRRLDAERRRRDRERRNREGEADAGGHPTG